MTRLHIIPIFALLATLPAVAQRGDKDPDRKIIQGSKSSLPGYWWKVRPDRGTADQISLSVDGDVYHFRMGPAGTFYRADWMRSGDFAFSARLTQLAAPSHPISYGLMIGGKNLDTSATTYTYFLVRNLGEYFIANWEGSAPVTVVGWTANPAIVKQGAAGKQTNTLSIQVKGDNAIFSVNGKEMTTLPKSKIHTDGMYNFRIGHNLDVDVDQVKRYDATGKLEPTPRQQ